MKKNIFSIFCAVLLLFANPFQANAGCQAGGPGATSCSLSGSIMYFGFSSDYTYAVTCGNGSYACCNNQHGTSKGSAVCKQNVLTPAD